MESKRGWERKVKSGRQTFHGAHAAVAFVDFDIPGGEDGEFDGFAVAGAGMEGVFGHCDEDSLVIWFVGSDPNSHGTLPQILLESPTISRKFRGSE